jgi:hypothetical protein
VPEPRKNFIKKKGHEDQVMGMDIMGMDIMRMDIMGYIGDRYQDIV